MKICFLKAQSKLFSYSTQLSMKFIMLVNVKMPTVVGILTFISIINTICKKSVYFPAFHFNDQFSIISCSVQLSMGKCLTPGPVYGVSLPMVKVGVQCTPLSQILTGFQIKMFSYFSTKAHAVGTQKDRLVETILLSTKYMIKLADAIIMISQFCA